ncbi:MAG: hypothetical protein V4640_06905 [Verrucomicrobiota bacterium]
MSWSDVYPIFADSQVESWRAAATPAEHAQLEEWCGVARVVNARPAAHLVAVSLFWKNSHAAHPELPLPTRERMMTAATHGLADRHHPWEHYVVPLLEGARILAAERPDAVLRVYLAADLAFLIDDLTAVGCEIALMHGSSIRHNPGAMWRFLALEESGRLVTIIDSDRARDVLHAIRRTERMAAAGLGLWRVPYIAGSVRHADDPGEYRPISACQFGAVGGYPMAEMMRAFLWHTQRGSMPDQCLVTPENGHTRAIPIFATDWPNYGFDEWFLIAVMFPRLAFSGVLTLYPLDNPAANHWFALDIEYCSWANSNAELLYFHQESWLFRLARNRARQTHRPPARSEVLAQILLEKATIPQETTSPPPVTPPGHVTLVVARYNEDLSWLTRLPADITVMVYNKGPQIEDAILLDRIAELLPLPNAGREPDTYLYHLSRQTPGKPDDWTVFCQGDPFPHSPNFINLLEHRDLWNDVQGLTGRYVENVPPSVCEAFQENERIRGISVRTEVCSAHTLDILMWRDDVGRRFFGEYCEHHGLPPGWSVSAHFLELCGLTDLAHAAWHAERLRFCYGAMFAVRNHHLSRIPPENLPRMRELSHGHFSHGYVFERLWLHLFGLPFPN